MKHPPPQQQIRCHPMHDIAAMTQALAVETRAAADRAIQERGRFLVVLAGGNTPRSLYETLRFADSDWSKWHIYFGDERCVPRNDAARNSRMAAVAWLDHVPIPTRQVHEMQAERGPAEAARLYNRTLAAVGDFDMVLLGLGEDGHVASLFPGRVLGSGKASLDTLPVYDAPKPPPHRVTLSAARFSRTRRTFFIIAGEEKRNAVGRWAAGEPLPAAAIRPASGVDVYMTLDSTP